MHKLLAGLIILWVSLGYSSQVLADLQSDILGCSALQNNADRLDCYDTAAKYYKPGENSNLAALLLDKTTSISTPDAPLAAKAISKPEQTKQKVMPASAVVATAKPEQFSVLDAFGQSDKVGLQSIQSRLIGNFTSWQKGMKFTLENGQVWKVTSNRTGYKKMTNPAITITRGTFGSFDAKVEGLNTKAKVRRIK